MTLCIKLYGQDQNLSDFGLLAKELRSHAVDVELRTHLPVASDMGAGYFLIDADSPPAWMFELPALERADCLRRVFLLNCSRPPMILAELEAWRIAGGIHSLTLAAWSAKRHSGYGIAGLRAVVHIIGGKFDGVFASDRYCIYDSATSRTLPQALVEYLTAYDIQMQE